MDPYQNRRWVIILVIIAISLIFSLRLLYIQVIDKEWSKRACFIYGKKESDFQGSYNVDEVLSPKSHE